MKNKQLLSLGLVSVLMLAACSDGNQAQSVEPTQNPPTAQATVEQTPEPKIWVFPYEQTQSSPSYIRCKKMVKRILENTAPPENDVLVEAKETCRKGVAKNPDSRKLVQYSEVLAHIDEHFMPLEQRVAKWQAAAKKGNVHAQYSLGAAYSLGDGVPKDMNKAIELFKKAAKKSDADAAFNLGVIYMTGDGVPVDNQQAKTYFEQAAAKNDERAMAALGQLYELGKLGAPDDTKAFEYYQNSAFLGDADALFNAGIFYYEGKGTDKDLSLALACFEKSAYQGHEKAKMVLDGLAKGQQIRFNDVKS